MIVAADLPHEVQFRIASGALILTYAALVAWVVQRPPQPPLPRAEQS